MAKRKSQKKKTGRRRHRRVGALALNAASPLVQLGSLAAGFLTADSFINPAIDKIASTVDDKIKAGAQVGLGALLILNKKTKRSLPAVVAGGLVAGAGVKRGLRALGIMNGIGSYQSVPVIGKHGMNGYGKLPVLGYTAGQQLNGMSNGGFTVPKPIGTQVMGNASGSGVSHSSSSFMD